MTEYTWSPLTLNWISLKPPASEADTSMVSVFQPCALAKRSYILYRSPAKMAASSPPAAARISTMMSLSSAGSAGMSMNLMSSSSAGSFASIPAISSCANSFMSGSASISLASAEVVGTPARIRAPSSRGDPGLRTPWPGGCIPSDRRARRGRPSSPLQVLVGLDDLRRASRACPLSCMMGAVLLERGCAVLARPARQRAPAAKQVRNRAPMR